MTVERVKSRRGFAAMDPETHREIARLGGLSTQRSGVAHRWTPEQAREMGRIGGTISRGGGRKLKAGS